MSDGASRSWLEVDGGEAPPQCHELTGVILRIGRASTCDLRIELPQVSRNHAEIHPTAAGYELRDIDSSCGVFVNGDRVGLHLLRDGDVVELGPAAPTRLTFHSRAAVAETHAGATDHGAMAHLARFFEFSRKLGGSLSLDEVLREVVDLAIATTRAERGALVHLDARGGLTIRVARSSQGGDLPTAGLRVSATLVRQALREGAPLIVGDTGADDALSQVESIVSLELRSAVILPLAQPHGGDGGPEASGVLYLDSKRRRGGVDSLDLRILERLAHDTSAAIENARLLQQAEAMRRMEQEVEMAREVQSALMPDAFDATPAFDVTGRCVPCLRLGGDYVDQFDQGGGRSLLVVADVCGKGIAASLLAAALQGALAAEIAHDQPIAEIVGRVNRVHSALAPIGKFVTMALVLLEPDGRLWLVNAGHCPPLHVHARGVRSLSTGGVALGLDEDADFGDASLLVEPGEFVVLYSDGVIECEGPDRELYGTARLERLLAGCRGCSAQEVLAAIDADLAAFRGDIAVTDDLSIVVVRRR